MDGNLENRELAKNLPTGRILAELRQQIATGKALTIDKGSSNTVEKIYSIRLGEGLDRKAYIVKTYKPVMRGENSIPNSDLAANMVASVDFHRTFLGLGKFMVDTDVAITDLGDEHGERVCVIQERAAGRQLNVHMAKMADPKTRELFAKLWAYGRKDTVDMRTTRHLVTLRMFRRYAGRLRSRLGGKGSTRPSEEEILRRILDAAKRLDKVLAAFLDGLLKLLTLSEEARQDLYKKAGISFAMKSSANRGTQAVTPGKGIAAPDLFRMRNIMEEMLSGDPLLFDVSDLRYFETLEELMDHFVTGLRQAFLFHYDPKDIRARLNANGDLQHAARSKTHPTAIATDIPVIPGEYSYLLPVLPETERLLNTIVGMYKAGKVKRTIGRRMATIRLPATISDSRRMRIGTSGD